MRCVDLWIKDKSGKWWRWDEGGWQRWMVKKFKPERESWRRWGQSQNVTWKSRIGSESLLHNLQFFFVCQSFLSCPSFFLTFFSIQNPTPFIKLDKLTCQVWINISLAKQPFIKMGCFPCPVLLNKNSNFSLLSFLFIEKYNIFIANTSIWEKRVNSQLSSMLCICIPAQLCEKK